VVVESDGDLMDDGVNIAAQLEGIATPGAICLSEDAYRQVKSRLDIAPERRTTSPAHPADRVAGGLGGCGASRYS
jgi:adenylate cyclase